MADYTIVANNTESNQATVVVEYDVPAAGTNDAGIQWRTIVAGLRAFDGTVGTSNPLNVANSTYLADLDAGTKLELPLTVTYNSSMTNPQKVAEIDAQVTAMLSSYTADFQTRYEFYGTERTV